MIRKTLVLALIWVGETVSFLCIFIIIMMIAALHTVDEIARSVETADTLSRRILRKIFR